MKLYAVPEASLKKYVNYSTKHQYETLPADEYRRVDAEIKALSSPELVNRDSGPDPFDEYEAMMEEEKK